MDDVCISHNSVIELSGDVLADIREYLTINADNLTYDLDEELLLLEQISEFELGRFLLVNKGLNGYWIDYFILGDHSGIMPDSFEYWLLNHAPIVKATKERFNIFQAETQKLINSNMNLASIPCGSMNDLLTLDYSNLKNMHLVGVDIDLDSINLTHNNINKDENKKYTYEVIQGDAWELEKFLDKKFDLITSNGLNIYESNETKLIELYKFFYSSLTPGGYLITSFISQSPMVNKNSPWKDYNLEDLKKQKAVFGDIIKAKWQNSLSEEKAVYQLEAAGFKISEVIYDSQGMFPTIVAYRNV